MKEFEPSKDFVSRVMGEVYKYEQTKTFAPSLSERFLASRPFRYVMSGGGVLVGIFIVPAHCI